MIEIVKTPVEQLEDWLDSLIEFNKRCIFRLLDLNVAVLGNGIFTSGNQVHIKLTDVEQIAEILDIPKEYKVFDFERFTNNLCHVTIRNRIMFHGAEFYSLSSKTIEAAELITLIQNENY